MSGVVVIVDLHIRRYELYPIPQILRASVICCCSQNRPAISESVAPFATDLFRRFRYLEQDENRLLHSLDGFLSRPCCRCCRNNRVSIHAHGQRGQRKIQKILTKGYTAPFSDLYPPKCSATVIPGRRVAWAFPPPAWPCTTRYR